MCMKWVHLQSSSSLLYVHAYEARKPTNFHSLTSPPLPPSSFLYLSHLTSSYLPLQTPATTKSLDAVQEVLSKPSEERTNEDIGQLPSLKVK